MQSVLSRRRIPLLLLAAFAYGISPVDLVPDAVPILGMVDDLGIAGSAMLVAFAWWRRGRGPHTERTA